MKFLQSSIEKALYILLFLVFVLAGFIIYIQGRSIVRLQSTVENFQAQVAVSRQTNAERLKLQNEYFKCLALAKFDYPPEQFQTRDGTEKALDTCATNDRQD